MLLSLETALSQVLNQARKDGLSASEVIATENALGRVLARPLVATIDVPPWPNSSMDGYAVRSADIQAGTELAVSQKIFAGQIGAPLAAASCARIFTGAPLPAGADAVEMQENTSVLDNGQVRFSQAVAVGKFVRKQGQDCQVGDEKLAVGSRLGPTELALAASLGVTELCVYRRLKVAVISTGDELVEPGQALQPGQIYNSNRPLLKHWLQQLGCEVLDIGILPDDLERTRAALNDIQADLILSSAGVSVGEADFLGQIIRQEGELSLWKLALKPGKPFMLGYYHNTPVIGLPGNPVSTLVTFALLARAYILTRMGCTAVQPLSFLVPVNFALVNDSVRREFLRVKIINGQAVQYGNQNSGVLSSTSWADGLLEMPENSRCEVGDRLKFYPFSELF